MIWGLVFSELTTSNIVELDAGSYVISGIIGIITIYVSHLQEKPTSESHPLGYSGFIPILNLVRNLMIVMICINAIGESLGSLVRGPSAPEHGLLFLYASVTLLVNLFCAIYIHKASVKLKSPLLKTDALEWRLDTVSNISIIGAFLIAYILDNTGNDIYAAYIDPIVCILFSVYMCISPGKLFFENMQILSAVSIDKEAHTSLVDELKDGIPLFSLHATHFTIFYVAGILWVNIDINTLKDIDLSLELIQESTQKCQAIINKKNPHNKLTYSYKLID